MDKLNLKDKTLLVITHNYTSFLKDPLPESSHFSKVGKIPEDRKEAMKICYVADGACIHTQRRVNYFARKGQNHPKPVKYLHRRNQDGNSKNDMLPSIA